MGSLRTIMQVMLLAIPAATQLCNSASCPPNYTCNANQYCVLTRSSLVQTEPSITIAAIAGIVLGWLIGLVGLFLLGLWLIFYYFRKRYHEDEG